MYPHIIEPDNKKRTAELASAILFIRHNGSDRELTVDFI
jgi:hypothetical protein